MFSGFCLRILFAFFPAYVSCLGIYEGKVPNPNVQRVSARTYPEIGPEVKQDRNWIDSTYSSVHLPHTQRRYVSYQKERLIKGSHLNDCPTQVKSDNQDNVINKPSASVANNHLGFGQPSSLLHITATDIFKNVQPVSQLAYTSSQGESPFGTPKLLGSKPFKSSSDESSHELPKFSTAGSSKIFAVQAPEHTYGHFEFKPQLTKNMLARGPNQPQSTSTSSQFLHQHRFPQGSQSTRNVQLASSTYSPFLGGTPMLSITSSRKHSHDGLKYTEAKPSIVSSGPIFVLQGSESTRGLGSYSKHPNFVKPLGVLGNVDSNQNVASQSSETSRVTLNINSQPNKSWNDPFYCSMKGGQRNASLKPRKPSGSDCRDCVGKYSSVSSDKILNAPKSAEGNKLLHHPQDVWDTRNLQKTYNARDPSQSRFPVYSVSESQPNYILGARRNVPKSSIASSGEIRIMQVPATVQSRTHSNKPQVTSKPHPSFPEYGVIFASNETPHQYQLLKTNQKPRNVQPTPGTYASPPQSGYQAFSFKRLPYKPRSVPSKSLSESGSGAIKQSVGDSEMKAVRVRLNKWPKSISDNLKDQWASGDNVDSLLSNSGALQSFLPQGYLGQKQGQNVQTHARSSVPQYHGSNEVQSKSTGTNEITTSLHEFGKDLIRRLSPTFSSSYRPAPQNQAQRVDSSAPGCKVTQNHPLGLGQQGPVPFQGVKHSSSRINSQCLL